MPNVNANKKLRAQQLMPEKGEAYVPRNYPTHTGCLAFQHDSKQSDGYWFVIVDGCSGNVQIEDNKEFHERWIKK